MKMTQKKSMLEGLLSIQKQNNSTNIHSSAFSETFLTGYFVDISNYHQILSLMGDSHRKNPNTFFNVLLSL